MIINKSITLLKQIPDVLHISTLSAVPVVVANAAVGGNLLNSPQMIYVVAGSLAVGTSASLYGLIKSNNFVKRIDHLEDLARKMNVSPTDVMVNVKDSMSMFSDFEKTKMKDGYITLDYLSHKKADSLIAIKNGKTGFPNSISKASFSEARAFILHKGNEMEMREKIETWRNQIVDSKANNKQSISNRY